MKEIIKKLEKESKTISTMESCTGGFLANLITNIEGASDVFKFSAVTYSNEFKIKMGVDQNLIKKYSVYSKEVAHSMAYSISKFTSSDYGIGITGKLLKKDKKNLTNKDNIVYASIYSLDENKYYDLEIEVFENTREKNKMLVSKKIIEKLKEVI